MFPNGLFFPSLYALLFYIISLRLLWAYTRSKNFIALSLSISCFFYGSSDATRALSFYLFSTDMSSLAFWGNTVARFITLLGLSSMSVIISYAIFPKLKPSLLLSVNLIYSFIIFFVIDAIGSKAAISVYSSPIFYTPAFSLFIIRIQLALIVGPMFYAFARETLKSRLFYKSFSLAAGVVMVGFFEPLIFDPMAASSYFMLNVITIIGFIFLLIGVFLKTRSFQEINYLKR